MHPSSPPQRSSAGQGGLHFDMHSPFLQVYSGLHGGTQVVESQKQLNATDKIKKIKIDNLFIPSPCIKCPFIFLSFRPSKDHPPHRGRNPACKISSTIFLTQKLLLSVMPRIPVQRQGSAGRPAAPAGYEKVR
jgi:hypothetical protein